MPRKLRIAASVFFGLLTITLCLLWVRSYWRIDAVNGHGPGGRGFLAQSTTGRFVVVVFNVPVDWRWRVFPIPQDWRPKNINGQPGLLPAWGFYPRPGSGDWTVVFPFWFPVVSLASMVAALWFPYSNRFSLRTLLMATTLLAVVLGLGVWLAR